MKYSFTETARQAIAEIYFHGATQWSDDQAEAYQIGLISAVELLAKFPLIGKQVDEYMPGLKQYRYGKHYIFYLTQETQNTIKIIDIRHTRSDIRTHFIDN